MFVREYGLVHNDTNSERYTVMVRWETRWRDVGGGYEEYRLQPVLRECRPLDQRSPDGRIERQLVPVVVTELSLKRWPVLWPSEAKFVESEALRRERIRAIRAACHVDATLGAAEPQWREQPAPVAPVLAA